MYHADRGVNTRADGILHIFYRVNPIKHPGDHVQDSKAQQAGDRDPGSGNRAEPLGKRSMADIDITLDCQSQGEPVRSCVEDLRSCLQGELE